MSLSEFENRTDPKDNRYRQMRSVTDIGMGIVYTVVGFIIIFSKQLNITNENFIGTPIKIFGGFAIIYGVWRIYRGVKKNYFKTKR